MSRWDVNAVKELRGAVFRGDASVVVDVVRGRLNEDVLQLAGDGLLHAAVQGVPEAAGLAAECAEALRGRGWDGDDELADQLGIFCFWLSDGHRYSPTIAIGLRREGT